MRWRLARKIFEAGAAADYCGAPRVRRHYHHDISLRHLRRLLARLRRGA